jgi:tRNA A-37 threonylcarbamoyl transferase component Bud32
MPDSPDFRPNPTPGTSQHADATTLPPTGQAFSAGALDRLVLPGYEVLDILGRGGMAVVYKARQQSLRRLVAIKVVLAGQHASPEEITRFRIEVETVARLRHPNIVQIYEVGQHDGCPYCSLEFVEGGNLSQRLNGNPLPTEQAAQITEALARGMHAAHQRGIIHRDLKPSNVLLTADGQPKITDFGLAKWMDTDLGQTRTGAVMGTPSYMAPEQADGRSKEVGPAADVYGLGAILYELLTGRPPFQAETPLDTLLKVVSEEPVPPRRLRPHLPQDLQTICLKCLEKDPRRRYPSAEALADDLSRYLRGEAISARPPGLFGRLERWARLRPAFAVTLAALGFFYLNHLALMALGVEGEGGAFHRFVTGLLLLWALAAAAFQWGVARTRRGTVFTFLWAGCDVLLFTLLLFVGNGPRSALLPVYLLLIGGTALRLRIDLVWYVTALCLLSYGGLLAEAAWRRPDLVPGQPVVFIFVLSMATLAVVQYYLLRRVKAEGGNR